MLFSVERRTGRSRPQRRRRALHQRQVDQRDRVGQRRDRQGLTAKTNQQQTNKTTRQDHRVRVISAVNATR